MREKKDAQIEKLIESTMFLVEATDFEKQCLWTAHNEATEWESALSGTMLCAGVLDGRPVNVVLSFAKLKGVTVCFWHACSQVVDFAMVENTLKETFGDLRYDGGHRRASVDAQNFGHVLSALSELAPKALARKESEELEETRDGMFFSRRRI